MSNVKQDVELRLNRLPKNSSAEEDIQYHFYALDKVRRRLEKREEWTNQTLCHQEIVTNPIPDAGYVSEQI